jgi:TPP-dependent trihydroxycyclohexane-1,2-dione (THcHDO) dehydratase
MNAGALGRDRRELVRMRWPQKPIVVVAIGTRLQDFTTGSWTGVRRPGLQS